MLIYALDAQGRLVPSWKAIPGKTYYCPCCGATVRVKKSKKGNLFFFCFHSHHEEKDCKNLANQLADCEPGDLNIHSILIAAMRKPAEEPKKPRGPREKGPKKPTANLTTMWQLWASGIPHGDPDMPVQGGVLSDFIIGPRAFERCLADGNDIGRRVIVAKPDRPLSDQRIRFCCRWEQKTNGSIVKCRKYLVVRFNDADMFTYFRDRLFASKETENKAIWYSQYKWVMLVGNWHAVAKIECKQFCRRCREGEACNGMQIAECHTRTQIYIPTNKDNCISLK